MSFIEQLQLLQRLDRLILRKGTGSARELGALVGLSRSSVFNYLDTLRSLGAEIDYCEFRKSYFYINDTRPRLPILSAANSELYQGGKTFSNFFFGSPKFLDWGVSPLYQVNQQLTTRTASECASFWL
jgi:biotin operon repressor